MNQKLLSLFLAAGAILTPRPSAAQEYHSNDLTPAGAGSGKLTCAVSGKQVGGSQASGSYSPHAVLLNGNALTSIDLNPVTAYYSMATCQDNSQQGGWAYMPTGLHAVVWNGSADSYSDLNPSGYNFSYCLGVHNGEQVGYAQSQSYFVTASHAMSWHGSAASAVDLHTGTYAFSRALGCHDGEEVGYVSQIAYPDGESLSYHTTSHAIRWSGSAASAVDLHPAGFDASEATCTSGTQQGGWGYQALGTTHLHALLWSGDAATVVDLHPSAYSETKINAISGSKQVGEGWTGLPGYAGSVRHALAWSGTAESAIDLNQYLPAGYAHGVATGVDADGNVVGYAYNNFVAGLTIPQDAVAVIFAPGAPAPAALASFTVDSTSVAPDSTVQGTVALGGAAPAGGVNISFLSTSTALVSTPASLSIPEGESTATFSMPVGGATLTTPTRVKIYSTDGTVSQSAAIVIAPVVKILSVSGNAVEGGFSTYGSVSLTIPAQTGGAVVSLTSGDPSLLSIPATVSVPQGYTGMSFVMNTVPVAESTPVAITATWNGQSVSGNVTLSAAPVVSVSNVSVQQFVGGQTVTGTVSLNNFPRAAAGATVTLSSSNASTLQVPATVTIPYGAYSASFSITSTVVTAIQTVSINAGYADSNIATTVAVNPIPTVVITSASYDPVTQLFKVTADTSYANSILTFGTTAAGGAVGVMQFELGTWKGSTLMTTAPTTATVWNSNGGQSSMTVTNKGISSGGGGSGGGGGGGGGGGKTTTTTTPTPPTTTPTTPATTPTTTPTAPSTATYKLATSKTGKGTVTLSPAGPTFPAGTVVTATATPDAGSPWIGWSGGASGTAKTITITMTKDISITANFK